MNKQLIELCNDFRWLESIKFGASFRHVYGVYLTLCNSLVWIAPN